MKANMAHALDAGLITGSDGRANEITSLDAAMTPLFHVVAHLRGASEFIR